MTKGTDMLDKLANLSPAQRALLAKRLREKQSASADTDMVRRKTQEPVELSYAQQRLWFLDRLEPNSAAYNLSFRVRLTGELQLSCLEQSIRNVMQRHEVLRTRFQMQGEHPVQAIAEEVLFRLQWIEVSDLPEEKQWERIEQIARQEAERPFRLDEEELLRALVLKRSEREHILLFTIHHIVTDGWSMGILVREMAMFYAALMEGKQPVLPELPVQYADYSLWQRQVLSGERMEKQLTYWRQQLAGAAPVLQLPTDRTRPSMQTYNGDVVPVQIPAALVQSLQQLGREEGATLFMTLLAAWKILLHRYSKQEDLLVGSPIANRQNSKVENLIGYFANTLVFRTTVTGDLRFRDFLRQVRQVAFDAYQHQDVPFEKLVGDLLTERNVSFSPLFQVMFVLQNTPQAMIELPDLTLEIMEVENRTTKFDLLLNLNENEAGIAGTLEYNTDLFDAQTIADMNRHFGHLLEAIVRAPDVALSELPLLSEEETRRVLVEWNESHVEFPQELPVHALLEAQAARTPDAEALLFRGESMTYRALHARANQLARHLQTLGVGPDVCVGIALNRSFDLILAVLAIWKAGGAYVSLDPSYPQERLAYIIEDTRVPVVLTEQDHVHLFADSPALCLQMKELEATLSAYDSENLPWQAGPDHLAYLIYTSGSTGKPKGVAMEHRPLTNLIHWQVRHFAMQQPVRTLQFASLNFDVSFQEIASTLASGGTLVLIEDDVRKEPALLLRYLHEHRIARVFFPFVAFQQLAEATLAEQLPPLALREIITAGEQLTITHSIKQWLSQLPGCVVRNQYGPSETHVVSEFVLDGDAVGWESLPPIGRPIDNVELYVLDDHLRPLPLRVPGELYIGGTAMARGYLNRSDLTSERFVPHPFVEQSGARLYKTGDLVRYRPDGNLEFLGRVDNQVKVRGFRIELGEIEGVLGQYQGIQEQAVIVREDVPGDKRLVGYLVVDRPDSFSVQEVRAFLLTRLPEYMVPSLFVLLDQLPLTPSGKLDRRSLPLPTDHSLSLKDCFIAPSTETERKIAEIWSDILRVSQIGIHHNFFELGGHSLLATQIMTRLNRQFGTDIPLRTLFEAPTVALLAEAVDLEQRGSDACSIPPLVKASGDQRHVSFAQERLLFFEELEPGTATYHIPVGIRMRGALDVEALRASFGKVIARHESLRTVFPAKLEHPQPVVKSDLTYEFTYADLQAEPTECQDQVLRQGMREEAVRPFDLLNGPLLRLTLFRLQPEEHVLLLTIHHLVADGWSMGVLVKELASFYTESRGGDVTPPADLDIQYGDYAAWQRMWLQGDVLQAQLAYWKEKLTGPLPVLQLPTDHVRPAVQTYNGTVYSFRLPQGLTDSLKRLGQQEQASLYMTLLATFYTMLYRYTGQSDLLVGTPVAGRTQPELEALIGLFINTLVLRQDLQEGELSFRELLRGVREETLAAFAHQDLPFEKLVEQLSPERRLSVSPLFQVMFILQNAPLTLEMPGLEVELLEPENTTAKYDLTLVLSEEEGGLRGSFEYNTDLFEAGTIERMAAHFVRLADSVVEKPDTAVGTLPLMLAEEREFLLHGWNDNRLANLTGMCIHERVARQAERTPDATAVIWQNLSMSYRELNEQANRLAHHLRGIGVGNETIVGVCMNRTPQIVVALLAILKAGGAYLPLDPNYPQDRIVYMLNDAKAHVLLTDEVSGRLLPTAEMRVIRVDADQHLWADAPSTEPQVDGSIRDLAYVIYTSGSTGKPKGVAIEHHSVSVLIDWAESLYTADELAGVLFGTSICFDLSVFELFVTLSFGGAVIVADNVLQLPDLPAAKEVTLVNTVPSAIAELVRQQALPASVRVVNLAGEPLKQVIVNQLYALPHVQKVYNLYGPTEDTTYSTVALMEKDSPKAPTIGVPVANTRIHILDKRLQPVPIGVAGELYITGDGLARGYLHRPELTAEKFILNPFDPSGQTRLYKTGDLARFLPTGEIDYLGRIDHQVKIRGFRVELGEIEEMISKHPAVKEVVVVSLDDVTGSKRLVAYLSLHDGSKIEPAVVRGYLNTHLPEYMVPSHFVVLEALPLTPNGKIDRMALPKPELHRGAREYVAPRTPLEAKVAEVWADVFGLDRVSATDDFFELGGHSLLATQVISRIRRDLNIELQLRSLFETPTVEGVARALEARRQERKDEIPPMVRQPRVRR